MGLPKIPMETWQVRCSVTRWHDSYQSHLNTFEPGQNGHHFVNIFQFIHFYHICFVLTQIPLKFVPGVQSINKAPLVQIPAWHRACDRPLSGPMMTKFSDGCMRYSALMNWMIYMFTCLFADIRIEAKQDCRCTSFNFQWFKKTSQFRRVPKPAHQSPIPF